MDSYCEVGKLRKTTSKSLLLFIRQEGRRRVRDKRQKDRRAANPSAPSPPLSSVKTALVFKNFAQRGNGSTSD